MSTHHGVLTCQTLSLTCHPLKCFLGLYPNRHEQVYAIETRWLESSIKVTALHTQKLAMKEPTAQREKDKTQVSRDCVDR